MSTEIQYTTRQIRNFTKNVNKRGPDDCWEWMGLRGERGHGRINFDHVVHQAHRVAWELANGPIPPGLVVRHTCDFAPCCNPAHLELGTRADNNRDRHISGRRPGAPNTYTPPKLTIEERFYAMVSKTPTDTGCIEWLGAHGPSGHGRFGIGGKKTTMAYRFAWELVHGPIPAGMSCLHKCDNPKCVNVAHIYLGTQADNVRDMYERGRAVHNPVSGEQVGTAKLSTEQVKEIRGPKYETWDVIDIAAQFGVSSSCVCGILKRQSWAHLDSNGDAPIRDRQARGEHQGGAKLSEAQVLEMRSNKFDGCSYREIAKHFSVATGTVANILRRERWAHLDSSDDAPIVGEKERKSYFRGEKNGNTKLTDAQVIEIRSEKYAKLPQREVAKCFGITQSSVWRIRNRKVWTHI